MSSVSSRAVTLGAVLLVGTLSCGSSESGAQRDSLAPREHDSTLGASQLPGAQGIRGALRVSDSAAARRAREATADQEP